MNIVAHIEDFLFSEKAVIYYIGSDKKYRSLICDLKMKEDAANRIKEDWTNDLIHKKVSNSNGNQ